MISAHPSSNDLNNGNDQVDTIAHSGQNQNIPQEHLLEMDNHVKNELNVDEYEKDGNDNNNNDESVHLQQDHYYQENSNLEPCKAQDPSRYGSTALPSNPYVHEPTPPIINSTESGPVITSMIENGRNPQSSWFSHGENTIYNHHTRNQRENAPRPTRESVLRRLSDALLRKSLTLIDLSQRGLRPSDARLVKLALLQNSNLSVLKLGYNNLSDEGIITLASGISTHSALKSLDVGFNNVGNEGCAALASAIMSAASNGGSLHTLYLAGNCITKEGAFALSEIYKEGVGIRRLHVTGNKFGPDGVHVLVQAMIHQQETIENTHHSNSTLSENRDNGEIEELFLGGTGMGSFGCESVANLLAVSKTLRVISLANCYIGDKEAEVLAHAISKNVQELPLISLQLSFNSLTCKGIESLMNAIWNLRGLKKLKLDNNRMEARGAQVVSAVIGAIKTLTELDVGFNCIGSGGMRLLMKAVADSRTLLSLSVSGNSIDIGSAKAVAYALAHNCSLKSLFLDHCLIQGESQRHITAGIVSNSGTKLEVLTGFPVGINATSLGLPSALEHWTNEQVLKFVLLMWKRMHQEQNNHLIDKEIDPLNCLDTADTTVSTPCGPLDPSVVVDVAKRAYKYLCENGDELFSHVERDRSVSFECPLTEDVVIVESNTPSNSSELDEKDPVGAVENHYNNNGPNMSRVSDHLSVQDTSSTETFLNATERKKEIVKWLCNNIQHLNELSHLPFDSSELWRLHQYFFSPTIQIPHSQDDNWTNGVMSDLGLGNSISEVSENNSILSAPCISSPCRTKEAVPSSEPVIHENVPILKRKVSYRFLNDATLSSASAKSSNESQIDKSVSKLIEGMNGHSMQPRSKKARKNLSRISIVPRIKKKLDSFLDSDHNEALILMRQLQYVENHLLKGDIYPVDAVGTTKHLIGSLASDAEMILLDMM